MVKPARPKSVLKKNKNIILDELNLENKKENNKNKKNKIQLSMHDSNSNLFFYLKEKDKKKVKNNLLTTFNNKSSKNFNILNKINNKNYNQAKNEFSIIFPKLNNITETNYDKNYNFRDITNRIKTEYNIKEQNNSKYNSRDKIQKEEKKNNLKNFFTKDDFTYFC